MTNQDAHGALEGFVRKGQIHKHYNEWKGDGWARDSVERELKLICEKRVNIATVTHVCENELELISTS